MKVGGGHSWRVPLRAGGDGTASGDWLYDIGLPKSGIGGNGVTGQRWTGHLVAHSMRPVTASGANS